MFNEIFPSTLDTKPNRRPDTMWNICEIEKNWGAPLKESTS